MRDIKKVPDRILWVDELDFFLIKSFLLLLRHFQNVQITFHDDWWIDFALTTGWRQWVGFYSNKKTGIAKAMTIFTYSENATWKRKVFGWKFFVTIKYLINRKLKKQISDTCPHKHGPDKTNFQHISFHEKKLKSYFL